MFKRFVAMLLAAVLSAGCVTWRPMADTERYVTAAQPDRVRLDLINGRQVEVQSPSVVGDRIVGSHRTAAGVSRVAIQTRNVSTVRDWQIDPVKTTFLASALTVAGILVVATLDGSHASGLKVRF